MLRYNLIQLVKLAVIPKSHNRTVNIDGLKGFKLIKMTTNCVFCKIIEGTEKAEILYQDDQTIIFKDIKPAATHHYLVVPKTHLKNAKTITAEDKPVVEKLYSLGKERLNELGIEISDAVFGFHWPPFNSIQHLHLHVIAPKSDMNFISRTIFKPNSLWFVTPEYVLDKLSAEETKSNL